MVSGIETTYMDFTRRTAKYPKRREKEYLLCDVYDIKISELMINNMDKLFNRMSKEEKKDYRGE